MCSYYDGMGVIGQLLQHVQELSCVGRRLARSRSRTMAITLLSMDEIFATVLALFCTDAEIYQFAATCPSLEQVFLSDNIWQGRLVMSHVAVLRDLGSFSNGSVDSVLKVIGSSRKLHSTLSAVSGQKPPLLVKPPGAMKQWGLDQHKAWQKAVVRWVNLRQAEVLCNHLNAEHVRLVLWTGGLDHPATDLKGHLQSIKGELLGHPTCRPEVRAAEILRRV